MTRRRSLHRTAILRSPRTGKESLSHALCAFAFAALSLASVTAARAEIIVKTDSLPETGTGEHIEGVPAGARIATLLTAPVDGTIVGVQILWGSLSGNAGPSQEAAIRISSFDLSPYTPVATLATINSPTLIDGAVNEYRFLDPTTNLIPLAVPISAGTSFFVDLELANANTGTDPPFILLDGDGDQGTNSATFNGALWFPFTLAIRGGGDLGIRAIIQPVPEPSSCVLAAMGVVVLLGVRRRISRH